MHRPASGLCKLGLRARAEERHQWENEEMEDEKKPHLGFNAEQAVHLIPLLLLACLLVLYVFSYTPVEGSVPEIPKDIKNVKKPNLDFPLQESILMGKKEEALQSFSVYSHRSLHQVQKQQKVNKYIPKQQKETKNALKHPQKDNKHDARRTRLKKNSSHRKTRIFHTHTH
eukprot:Gb_29604 [translate_table: standard]